MVYENPDAIAFTTKIYIGLLFFILKYSQALNTVFTLSNCKHSKVFQAFQHQIIYQMN